MNSGRTRHACQPYKPEQPWSKRYANRNNNNNRTWRYLRGHPIDLSRREKIIDEVQHIAADRHEKHVLALRGGGVRVGCGG